MIHDDQNFLNRSLKKKFIRSPDILSTMGVKCWNGNSRKYRVGPRDHMGSLSRRNNRLWMYWDNNSIGDQFNLFSLPDLSSS